MAQGDASQYPVLPISLSIMTFCFLISLIISQLVDLLYDLYLVKFSKISQKTMIEDRVKSDLKRFKQFFQSQKLEKFDANEAKNRLTIITKLMMEKINSKENRPYLDAAKQKSMPTETKQQLNEEEKKDLKSSSIKNNEKNSIQEIKKVETLTDSIPKASVLVKNELNENRTNKTIETSRVIINSPIKLSELKKISIQTQTNTSFLMQTNSEKKEEQKPKMQIIEVKNENKEKNLKEITVEEALKKLNSAPKSSKVFIELENLSSRVTSPTEDKIKQTLTIENDLKIKRAQSEKQSSPIGKPAVLIEKKISLHESTRPRSSRSPVKLIEQTNDQIQAKNSKTETDDLLEYLGKKTSLSQSLSKTYRDHQDKMIQERLKSDAEFRKTRHSSPDRKRKNVRHKYDDENDFETDNDNKTQVIFE